MFSSVHFFSYTNMCKLYYERPLNRSNQLKDPTDEEEINERIKQLIFYFK